MHAARAGRAVAYMLIHCFSEHTFRQAGWLAGWLAGWHACTHTCTHTHACMHPLIQTLTHATEFLIVITCLLVGLAEQCMILL